MKINSRTQKKFVNFLQYIYAPVIVMIILLIVFIDKGLYPFGKATIDYLDMGQVNVPMYYHLYDAMHGTKSLFFDWYTALGINMSESVSICSLLSPFNLFFYFVRRENILQSLSIFTMIKMMAMAASMFIFLHKKFSVNIFWKVLFSVSYSFSGFVLQYYTNNQWLDMAAMFPLLLLSMYVIFQKNRIAPYIIMLTLCLITNFYSSAMILMFLFFIGGLYIMLLAPKDRSKHQVWSLGIGTLSAIGLSAIIVLPTYKQIMGSGRMGETQSDLIQQLMQIYKVVNYTDKQKWWMLFGTALVMVIIVKGIIANRKDRNKTLFIIGSIFFVTIQICFENINLIWHAGSYVCYPLRFGYMISFVLLSAGCYYVSKNNSLNELNNDGTGAKDSIIQTVLKIIIGLCIVYFIFNVVMRIYNHTITNDNATMLFNLSIVAFIILLVAYAVILNKHNRFLNYRWISVLVASELLVGAFIFIHPSAYTISPWIEGNSNFVYTTNEIKQNLNILPSQLDRIKNVGNTLNANYPFILQRPALSNYTHSVTSGEQKNFENMGYSINYTRLLDSGGTVFSDALINVKNTLSTYDLDQNMYKFVAEKDSYRLYENKYTLPFGLTVSSDITSLHKQYENSFEYQNALFELISGQKELIYSIKSNGTLDSSVITNTTKQTSGNSQEIEYTLHIQGNQALYFYPNGSTEGMSFYIQDRVVPIPSIERENNTQFPALFNSNVLSFGAFKDQTVKLKIVYPFTVSENQIQLGLLDLDKLGALTKQYDGYTSNEKSTNSGVSLTVTGSAEKDMLFLPISYDEGWSCSVNGRKATIEPVANSFIGVRLKNGENRVQLTFIPSGMNAGGLISLITLLMLISGFFIQKKTKLKIPENLLTFVEIAFCLIWGVAVMMVYIVPIGYTLFQKFLYKL
jgi:uncharacterized membrane protein YfhO